MKIWPLPPAVALGLAATGFVAALTAAAAAYPDAWGLDSICFVPSAARWSCVGASLAGLALVWSGTLRSGGSTAQVAASGPRGNRGARQWVVSLGAAVAAGILLWVFRDRTHFLGDSQVYIDNMRDGVFLAYSEPLAVAVWHLYVLALGILHIAPSSNSLAVLPVLCGLGAGGLLWGIAGEITESPRARLASFALLASLGSSMLYFGYVEAYPIVSLAILGYLLAALRASRSSSSRFVAGGALGVALVSHLVCAYLIPSYVYLALRARAPAWRRIVWTLVPLALAAAGFWLLRYSLREVFEPFQVVRVALESSAGRSAASPFSIGAPVIDVLSLLLLVMPVPFLAWVARLASRRHRNVESTPGATALAIAAGTGGLVAILLAVPGSPAQDWDLMAMTVLPLAVFAVLEVGRFVGNSPARVRSGLVVIAFASLAPFVLVNREEQAGLRRLEALVSDAARLSSHERAYGNEKLARAHMRRHDYAAALPYAERSLAYEPTNARYWTNVGMLLTQLGRTGEAVPILKTAVRMAPERWDARYDLGLSYAKEERYPEAADALAGAVRAGADRPDVLHLWGIALYRSGRTDSALAVWRDIVTRWPEYSSRLRADRLPGGVPLDSLPR